MTDSSQWATMTLGELVDLRLSSVDKKSKPDETPVLLCNYTDVYRNRIIHSDLDFMEATATDREIDKCALQPGDVIITKDSEQYDDIGVPALVRGDAPDLVCGYHLAILRPRDDLIDGAYLFNALTTREVQHQFHAFANGVTRFGLRKADIERVQIPVPPMGEQRRIAGVLGCLDDKIELNRRMAETLEEMARALFRSWFVDFEPVRAKQEGRWRSGESLPGLPAQLYDSFPDRLEPSPLGPIPAGWQVAALGDVVKTVRGRSYKSAELAESEVALVTLKSFARGGGYREDGLKPYTGPYKPEQVVKPGEVVLACTDVTQAGEVVGRPAIVQPAPEWSTLVASLDTLIVRPRQETGMSRAFLYLLLGTPAFTVHALAHATGTTVLHLAKNAVPAFRFALPPSALIDAFNRHVAPVLGDLQTIHNEGQTLPAVRDCLLPRLLVRGATEGA